MSVPASRPKLPDLSKDRYALRAKRLYTMAGEKPSRGQDLFKPLCYLDNPLILIEEGRIAELSPSKKSFKSDYKEIDLGDYAILPPLVNAHTHMQLSWLEGQCKFYAGFSAWLEDMIPRLIGMRAEKAYWNRERRKKKLEQIFANLQNLGTYLLGDIGGTIRGELVEINKLAKKNGIMLSNFCERFGFQESAQQEIWPLQAAYDFAKDASLLERSSPCGHALYSTDPELLMRIKYWCREHKRIFCMHLAESQDEEDLLTSGSGPLRELYQDLVLPQNWKAYGQKPFRIAKDLGLVDAESLFVHGVHMDKSEIADFADNGAALCLCPRSNFNLGVGSAPIRTYIEKGARLCLGTDGLSSNTDLDVLNELIYYREKEDLPFSCLLRMCTVNGADALGFPLFPQLREGTPAKFSLAPIWLCD